jgi:hypothetical protein
MLSFLRKRAANASALAAPATMGAEQQTRLSWARVIESRDDVPGPFRAQLAALTDGAFPYCVLTPSFEGFLRRTNPRLICWQAGHVHILERTRSEVTITSFAPGTVHCVETGRVLLRAWLRLRGCTSRGLASAKLEFNVTTDRLFAPIIEGLRRPVTPAPAPLAAALPAAEGAKFTYLRERNFKLMNYGRGALLPGERVACTLYQPAIRRATLTAFGRTWTRPLTAAHLTILTDHELIIVRDEGAFPGTGDRWTSSARRFAHAQYGGAWTYIPLSHVNGVTIEERPGDLFALTIDLPSDDRVESLFEAGQRDRVTSLTQSLNAAH